MSSRFMELAIDCADPELLAQFWCHVLDYRILGREPGLVSIGPEQGGMDLPRTQPVAPIITFAHVPEGKTVKNRIHLDLRPHEAGRAEEVERLLALGARHADVGQGEQNWTVLVDPEGNEFCVLDSHSL